MVESHGGAYQRGDAVELLLRARLISRLATAPFGVDAVHEDGDRQPLDAACLSHVGTGRARDLVVDDLLVLARGVAVGLFVIGIRRLKVAIFNPPANQHDRNGDQQKQSPPSDEWHKRDQVQEEKDHQGASHDLQIAGIAACFCHIGLNVGSSGSGFGIDGDAAVRTVGH